MGRLASKGIKPGNRGTGEQGNRGTGDRRRGKENAEQSRTKRIPEKKKGRPFILWPTLFC